MTDTAFWNGLARKYAKSPISNVPAYEKTLERTRSHLRAEDVAIELGCGTGTTALKLAPQVASYTGTDIAPEMITIAHEKLADEPVEGLAFTVSDTHAAQFGSESFDVVLGFNIFHLTPDPDDAFRRARDLLRADGLFISKTPCLAKRWYLKPLIVLMRLVGKAPRTVHFLDVDDYDARIKAAGFEIVETGLYPPTAPSRFVVARKV